MNLTYTPLASGRETEDPIKTPTDKGRTSKLHTNNVVEVEVSEFYFSRLQGNNIEENSLVHSDTGYAGIYLYEGIFLYMHISIYIRYIFVCV